MASKRHRQLKPPRPARDKMAVAHRARVEQARRVELETEILSGSKPRLIRCAGCDSTFYSVDITPVCPGCGRTLVRRMP